jgi:Tol biopolymer transport system component/DNA-binding winged helix-turn-helix (wHTH) protein
LATFGSLRRARARFDSFQVDWNSSELFRLGARVPIQEQPLQILRLLLEADGKVVRREELRAALWPQDTFVDFEHGVNTAVKKLRQALEDSADRPKFVETLPKIGYRFLVPVEWIADAARSASPRVVEISPSGPTAVPPLAPSKALDHLATRRWRFITLAAVLLLLAAVGGYLLRTKPRLQSDKLSVTPFTSFPGFEVAPSFSPDGNQMVFSWFGYEKEFQFDLYVKQVGQERVVQLTHHPAVFLTSAWSPDGRFIAFMRQAEPEATGVYVIPALGGTERKLTNTTAYGSFEPIAVSWSADGKSLAFAKKNAGTDSSASHFAIHLINVETTEEQVLPDPSPDCTNIWQPTFSPDGKYLASVCVLTEGVTTIYVQTADGREAREVAGTKSSEGLVGFAWAADSQSVLYSSGHSLWRVPIAGGKPEKLLFAQDVETVAVARTGNRLAYSQVRHASSIWQVDLASAGTAAGPATRLISSTRGDAVASISPDGKRVSFQSWRSGSPEVWVCDRDGSNPVQLSSFGGPQIGVTRWSPDSRRIVFDLRASGNAELYVVNMEGGPPKKFPTGTANASTPFWSADGHWIYFQTERPDIIWKAPVEGGTAVRVTGEGRTWPQESTDGKRLYFYKNEAGQGSAWSASVNGGDEQPILKMPADVQWVPAENGIYFINGSPHHFSFDYFDFASQHSHKVADLPGLFVSWAPSISPDGRTLLVTGIEHSEGDIFLVDGFR